MSIKTYVAKLRKKPQHVRERIMLLSLACAAPVLFTVWFATFQAGKPVQTTAAFVGDLKGTVSDSFSNPIYGQTFGNTGFPLSPADDTSTASSDQTDTTLSSPSDSTDSTDSADPSVNSVDTTDSGSSADTSSYSTTPTASQNLLGSDTLKDPSASTPPSTAHSSSTADGSLDTETAPPAAQ